MVTELFDEHVQIIYFFNCPAKTGNGITLRGEPYKQRRNLDADAIEEPCEGIL